MTTHRDSLPSGRLGVVVEAAASLLAEEPRIDHAEEQGRRRVLRFLEFLVHRPRYCPDRIQADQVAEPKRTHRVPAAEHHSGVDVLR